MEAGAAELPRGREVTAGLVPQWRCDVQQQNLEDVGRRRDRGRP